MQQLEQQRQGRLRAHAGGRWPGYFAWGGSSTQATSIQVKPDDPHGTWEHLPSAGGRPPGSSRCAVLWAPQ